jgi:hypothetical protein
MRGQNESFKMSIWQPPTFWNFKDYIPLSCFQYTRSHSQSKFLTSTLPWSSACKGTSRLHARHDWWRSCRATRRCVILCGIRCTECGLFYSSPKNRPRRPRRGVEVYLYSFFNLGAGWGQRHDLPALGPGKTRHPLYRRLDGPQDLSGRVRKISPPTGI